MKIIIKENGPYVIDSDIPLKEVDSIPEKHGNAVLSYEVTKDYKEAKEGTRLCRCGHSLNKPYCDGHHAEIDFCGRELNDRKSYDEEAELLEGVVYDALDKDELCAVGRFCDRNPNFWYSLDERDGEETLEMGCLCPSGRLTVLDKKTGEKIEPKLEKEIYLVRDIPAGHLGPIHIRGGIEVVGSDGFSYEIRNRATLCRCGQSKNMPFCDASHLRCKHMEIKIEK